MENLRSLKTPIFSRLEYPSTKNTTLQSASESKIISNSSVLHLSKTNDEYRENLKVLNSRINTIIEKSFTLKSKKTAQVVDNSIDLDKLNKKISIYE